MMNAIDNYKKLTLFVLFQAAWFSIILLGSVWSMGIAVGYLLVVYSFIKPTPLFWLWVAGLSLVGIGMDAVLIFTGIYQFESAWLPLWLVSLWLVFIPMIPLILDWLFQYRWLPPLLGCIAGPLTYKAGSLLSDLTILSSYYYVEIALAWGIFMYLLVWIYPKFKETT